MKGLLPIFMILLLISAGSLTEGVKIKLVEEAPDGTVYISVYSSKPLGAAKLDWGDGKWEKINISSSDYLQEFLHKYSSSGNYTISLTVGDKVFASLNVTVKIKGEKGLIFSEEVALIVTLGVLFGLGWRLYKRLRRRRR